MITGCPSCATRDDLPARRTAGETWVSSCPACGHDWLEGNAVEIVAAAPERALTLAVDHGHDIDEEARRLAEAARQSAERHREERRRRVATLRGWAILVAAVAVPLAGALAFPESVIRAAPAAARIYDLAGVEVNVFGFTVREAASELQFEQSSALLVVRGEVVNVTDRPRRVPALRFVLRDGSGQEAYAWTLDGVGTRQLGPGEATRFVTRVAAPPPEVQDVEIRFARGD
jgi:hypothetical protein